MKKNKKNNNQLKDKFLELALVGIFWILLWIPMTYFVSKYGNRVVSDAEYYAVAEMASRPLDESPITDDEARVVSEMASELLQ